MSESPSVIVKRKNIQPILDYCLDNRIECKMTPRDMPEEWDLEFTLSEIMQAVNLGMFLKENKLELAGWGSNPASGVSVASKTAASAKPKTTRKPAVKETVTNKPVEKEETGAPAIFDETPKEEDLIFEDSKKTEEDLFM